VPNRATTELAVSPSLTELKASWRFACTYEQIVMYENATAATPAIAMGAHTHLMRMRFLAVYAAML